MLAKASDKDTETKGNQMTIHPIVLTTPPATIQGKALYLELVNNPDAPAESVHLWNKDSVKQVLILPQHLDEIGNVQPVQIWDRVISPRSLRSQWDNNKIGSGRLVKKLTEEDLGGLDSWHTIYNNYESDELASMSAKEKHEATLYTIFEKLKNSFIGTYTLRDAEGNNETHATQTWIIRDSKPLAIEITNEEFDQARLGKTPQAVIRRIQKARVSAGFPEKIV
jgi:hypothetical protein